MEFSPRRVVLFLLLSALFLISWKYFVVDPMQRAQQAALKRQAAQQEQEAEQKPAEDAEPPKDRPADPVAVAEKPAPPKPGDDRPEVHPEQEVALGSLEADSGYLIKATITTKGAAVAKIELNDSRYRSLDDPEAPLALVQPVDGQTPDRDDKTFRTFATAIPEIDQLLAEQGLPPLSEANWKVLPAENPDEPKVVLEYHIPHAYRVTKEYRLAPPLEEAPSNDVRDTRTEGHFLTMSLKIENLQKEKATVHYELQGPVGMPLEDPESTRKFLDIKLGTMDGGKVEHRSLTAKDLVEAIEEDKVEEWAAPFRYVGVDGQFFATLLYSPPETDTSQILEQYIPQALRVDKDESQKSEVSVLFVSDPIELSPNQASEPHEYTLFAGPKRESLLEPIGAGEILEFGWFAIISKGMLWILSFLHNALFLPYGLAIIGLTIIVRAALFPLSKKQAYSAKRMKELQPRLQELKKRYGDDKQKFAQAQMELFRDAGYNPFAGCLPMVLQLPIFIGLYSALSHAVDLRGAEFLWVKNLAAPDQLFPWPGGIRLPFLGHYFNLLPILTVVLFLVQQKMFMPAPDPNDEQAVMQHKVMNFMMIFMGFLFYHVPAGLCVYFIASSLWGMGERKLLDYGKNKTDDSTSEAASGKTTGGGLFKTVRQNGREKDRNAASKKRGKQSKSRR